MTWCFRGREWTPAIEAADIRTPARIHDLRSTFASDALAAGVPVFTLARIMGTSVRMIEKHYGALLDGAGAGIAEALDALDAQRDQATTKEDSRWPPTGALSGGTRLGAGTPIAGATRLELATSGVTGRRSNQLSYAPSKGA